MKVFPSVNLLRKQPIGEIEAGTGQLFSGARRDNLARGGGVFSPSLAWLKSNNRFRYGQKIPTFFDIPLA
jgi:hypothetical protein